MVKIALSLPDDLLEAIEIERKGRKESRSEFVRQAVKMYLRAQRERFAVERYISGYKEHPETEEERDSVEQESQAALAAHPWDDDQK